jgi:hypothetical protein
MKNIFESIKDKIDNRQVSNFGIIILLIKIVKQYPELRFCQILTILNLDKDRFYEESVDTLKRIDSKVKSLTKFKL